MVALEGACRTRACVRRTACEVLDDEHVGEPYV